MTESIARYGHVPEFLTKKLAQCEITTCEHWNEHGLTKCNNWMDITQCPIRAKALEKQPERGPKDTQSSISEICDQIKAILLDKNRKYGDSAIHPKRIFSKSDAIEQINVRIDDKISRIQSAQDDDTEDAELDLIGYLILKRVARIA